ncbi:MAG: lipopolysaccharide heptosyltransferase I [Cellvibrio sp.]|uniref:lipopolysaccharide heptosyltransferase I n=1 Tax=Cellvibrio sp. TaxID=1965322 RepID=UPI00271D4449|nr:lipopolysaccharide heptosyltransferase I [Cellvibrio sp.]
MKILVVRLSSLGDVLHLFPAISDLRGRFPDAEIHWLVEPAFAEMVSWHSAVNKVIMVPLRSHKKSWWKIPQLLRGLKRHLNAENYDYVLDAQGLLKSALLARLAGVDVFGFHADSTRESLAAKFYQKTASVASGLHVIEKNRQLVAQLFNADISLPADYGLDVFRQKKMEESLPKALEGFADQPYIVLLHGTTWNSKYWPESSWLELVQLLTQHGWRCLLPWGNEVEHRRAQRLQAAGGVHAQVLPKLSLTELMQVLLHAQGFVSVETGIGHLASVLDIPGIMLHGPTDPAYSGILGKSCQHITSGLDCSPCFKRDCPRLESKEGTPPCQLAITAQMVFHECMKLLAFKDADTSRAC